MGSHRVGHNWSDLSVYYISGIQISHIYGIMAMCHFSFNPHNNLTNWIPPGYTVLLPGKSHGQRSLVGCSPWGHEESDTTEHLHFHFHALEKETATHSSVLAWRIPGTAEPGGLPSMGSHRIGHHWSDLAAAAWYTTKTLKLRWKDYPNRRFSQVFCFSTSLFSLT